MMMRDAASIPASVKAFSNARRWESVSTVEPDFDDTTMAVRSRPASTAARTWSGSVESRTTRSTPAARVMTSGASDDPPMPQSTMRSTPSAASSSRSWRMTGISDLDSSNRSIQPRRTEASASASVPHRVGSLAISRDATCSLISVGRAESMACRAAPEATRANEPMPLSPSRSRGRRTRCREAPTSWPRTCRGLRPRAARPRPCRRYRGHRAGSGHRWIPRRCR